MFELNTGKGSNKLLNSNTIENMSNFPQSEFSINLLSDEPKIPLHPKSSNAHMHLKERYD